MRALVCRAYGPADTLEIGELPEPVAGPGEVVIAVAAAGVNFPDTLIVEGRYQFKPAPPFAPGGEAVGRVLSIGPGVTRFRPGDRVGAVTLWGGFAERVAVPETRVVPLPEGLDDITAAAMLQAHGTAIHALQDRAVLRPGERLLVLGAAGGTGLAAVALGAAMGSRVTAAAGSEAKCAIAREHGAAETICYADGELRAALKSAAPQGFDVVFDPLGDSFTEAALRATAWEGRLLIVGFAAGQIPRLPANLVLLKGCQVMGVFWGSFVERDPARHAANLETMAGWLAGGRLHPPRVEAVLPLDQGVEALRRIAARDVRGKLVLTTGG